MLELRSQNRIASVMMDTCTDPLDLLRAGLFDLAFEALNRQR